MQTSRPHRRHNPLTDEWVLVSPQRNNRPWQGAREDEATESKPEHDEACYLCPGNKRITGDRNPDFRNAYVFPNDFPALMPENSNPRSWQSGLFNAREVSGEARVICYSGRHDLSMSRLSVSEIAEVVKCWQEQHSDLSSRNAYVTIFENKGAAMGCSNPHPHGQVWASSFVPTAITKEDRNQKLYFDKNGSPLLRDYVQSELEANERIVVRTEHWVALVPYWAGWPFETMVIPLRDIARIDEVQENEARDLAALLKQLTAKYDNIFKTEFPYSMGWHGAPCQQDDVRHWCLHAHFYPPLLRSSTIRKFMVGFELLAETQRDLTPEAAATILRDTETRHYQDEGI